MSANAQTTPSHATALLEQLRQQAALERIQVSEASRDLTKFVQDNETDDPLLYPTEVNPFKEKSKCIIL